MKDDRSFYYGLSKSTVQIENYDLDCIEKMWTLNESHWYNKKKVYTKGLKEVTLNANRFIDSWGTGNFY